MSVPRDIPLAPRASRATPLTLYFFDRLDAIFLYLSAVHGSTWRERTARDTGISVGSLIKYDQGQEVPPVARLALLEYYALEHGFSSSNPALRKLLRIRRKRRKRLSENRKKFFLNILTEEGRAADALRKALQP